MENQLNEENLQLAFNFNPSNGDLTKNRIRGEILIEETNKRIAIQELSDKIAIDLGYSIDGDMENMEFTLNLEKLLIKTVCQNPKKEKRSGTQIQTCYYCNIKNKEKYNTNMYRMLI